MMTTKEGKKISADTKPGNQSSDKLLQILECLADCRQPEKLQILSERLDIPQPTALRYLNTLINQRYVYKDEETSRYALTWKICRFGHLVKSHVSVRDIVTPFLRELAYRLETWACLAAETDGELIYLDVIDKPGNPGQILQRIGKSAPMHLTGSGKVLLSGMAQPRVEAIAARGLEAYTEKSIVTVPALLKELDRVREEGYAVDDEECEEGIRCASVPLYDYTETIVAAISVFSPVSETSLTRIRDEFVPALRDTARDISFRLGSEHFI